MKNLLLFFALLFCSTGFAQNLKIESDSSWIEIIDTIYYSNRLVTYEGGKGTNLTKMVLGTADEYAATISTEISNLANMVLADARAVANHRALISQSIKAASDVYDATGVDVLAAQKDAFLKYIEDGNFTLVDVERKEITLHSTTANLRYSVGASTTKSAVRVLSTNVIRLYNYSGGTLDLFKTDRENLWLSLDGSIRLIKRKAR